MIQRTLNKVSNIMKKIDFYSSSLKIGLKGKRKSTTIFGGIISFFLVLFFIIIVLFLFVDLIQKKNQYFTSNLLMLRTPFAFNITNNFMDSEEKKIPFFLFSFFMYDDERKSVSLEEFSNYFYFEIFLNKIERSDDSNKQTIIYEYNIVKCSKQQIEDLERLKIFDNKAAENFKNSFFCIDKDMIEIQGNYVDKIYQFFSLKIKPCSLSLQKSKCETNTSLINLFTSNLNLEFYYSSYQIESNFINKIPIEYTWRKIKIKLSKKIYQKYDLYITYGNIFSEEDLVLKFLGIFRKNFAFVKNLVKNEATLGSSHVAIYLRSSSSIFTIYRSYKTFFNFISQLGGILKFLLIIGMLLVYRINLASILNRLGNCIFAVVSPEAEDIIKNTENLEFYLKNHTDKSPNEILNSNNKSSVEAEIYIDVYKYEKYKGLAFNLSDRLKNQFLKLCMKKKKNSNSENALNKIFEKRTLDKLEILKVLLFTKRFKVLKNVILKNKQYLTNINRKNMICFKNLNKLVDSIKLAGLENDGITIKEEENRVKREFKFIKGIRYFKNKPILDIKTDINIFKKYNWDKDKIFKYFKKVIQTN